MSRHERPRPSPLRTAYLVDEYPAPESEFVAREVRALRALRGQVRTFTLRPATAGSIRTEAERSEWATTEALLEGTVHPLRARLLPQRGPAPLLLRHLREAGLRHVHVHAAGTRTSIVADVATSATRMGATLDGEPWSWSLAVHSAEDVAGLYASEVASIVASASFVACSTEDSRSHLMAIVPPDQWSKLHIVRATIDARRHTARMHERQGRSGPVRILLAGPLVPAQGIEVLLDAVRMLPAGTAEVRVAGEGPLHADLAHLTHGPDGDASVRVLQGLDPDELAEQYAWADVACLPIPSGGLPVPLLEAMATGLPAVTTPVGGLPEVVRDGVSGLVVPPGRPDLLARALSRLVNDPGLRQELGTAASRLVLDRHVAEPNVSTLAALLQASPGVASAWGSQPGTVVLPTELRIPEAGDQVAPA